MSSPRTLRRIEIWSDVAANSGSRLAVVRDYLSAIDRRELNGRETLRVEVRRQSTSWSQIQERRVLRTVFADNSHDEWRIAEVREERNQRNQLVARVECESIKYDLTADLLERVEVNGLAQPYFELYGLTPAQHMSVILNTLSSSPHSTSAIGGYVSVGTMGASNPIDLVYDWASPLEAITNVAEEAGLEVDVRRTSTGYVVNLPVETNSSVAQAELRYGRNLTGVRRTSDTRKKQATRVYPRGGGETGARLTVADAQWVVESISTDNVTLTISTGDGSLVAFADQLNNLYVEEFGGTVTQIADSATDQTLTVASSAHAISTGERIWIRRNSSGADLTFLEHPTNKTTYGLIPRTLDRPNIPAVNNLMENAYLDQFSGGSPIDWSSTGSATLSESTLGARRRFGSGAVQVVSTAEGEGIVSAITEIQPSTDQPFYSAQVALWVVSGQVRLEIIDTSVNTGNVIPDPDVDDEVAFTSVTGGWVDNLGVGGIDFLERGSTGLRLRVVSHSTDGAEFYLDVAQLTNTAAGQPQFYNGRGSNDLWLEGNKYLTTYSTPFVTFDIDIYDLERVDPDAFQFDALAVGGTVRVRDTDLGVDLRTRVTSLQRNLDKPGETRVKLSNLPDDLTSRLGVPTRRHKSGRPEEKKRTLKLTLKDFRWQEGSTSTTFYFVPTKPVQEIWVHAKSVSSPEAADNWASFKTDPPSTIISGDSTSHEIANPASTAIKIGQFEPRDAALNVGQVERFRIEGISIDAGNIPDDTIGLSKLKSGARSFGFDATWSSTSAEHAKWSAGTLELGDGATFSISSGNTTFGAGGQVKWVYFDEALSTSTLQVSTSLADALGDEDVLLAWMRSPSGSTAMNVAVVPAVGHLFLNGDHISAKSISADLLRVNTLSAITADLGTVNAGTVDANVVIASSKFTATNPVFQGEVVLEAGESSKRVEFRGVSQGAILDFYNSSGSIVGSLFNGLGPSPSTGGSTTPRFELKGFGDYATVITGNSDLALQSNNFSTTGTGIYIKIDPGVFREIEIGSTGSGGSGYRILRIAE